MTNEPTHTTSEERIVLTRDIYIYKAEKLSVCLSDGHAAYSPDLARIDIVCTDNEALIIRLL